MAMILRMPTSRDARAGRLRHWLGTVGGCPGGGPCVNAPADRQHFRPQAPVGKGHPAQVRSRTIRAACMDAARPTTASPRLTDISHWAL